MSASILQQLLALYFAIVYSWQLSSSEKSLSRKKFIQYLMDFTDLFYVDIFLKFLLKCLLTLAVTQSLCWNLSIQPFCWLGDA